jgi:hypothetical protein
MGDIKFSIFIILITRGLAQTLNNNGYFFNGVSEGGGEPHPGNPAIAVLTDLNSYVQLI